MYISDPIGDFLSRIRNAIVRQKATVTAPASKMLVSIANILMQEGFVDGVEIIEMEPQNMLEVTLKYRDGQPAIRNLRRLSTPGVRRYIGYRDIKKVLKGQGISILSTPQGVMTAEQARAKQIGGESICEIW